MLNTTAETAIAGARGARGLWFDQPVSIVRVRQEIQREVQPQFVPNSSHSAKYSRSLPQLPRLPSQNPYSPVENDDIHEAVPVKSEPLPSGPEQAYPVEMVGAPDEYPVEYSEYQEDAPGETGFTDYTEQAVYSLEL